MGKHSATPPQPGSPEAAAAQFDASIADSTAKTEARGHVPDLPPTSGKHGAGSATATNGSGNN